MNDISSKAASVVVITYTKDDDIHYISLDAVDSCTVDTSSNVTQHPTMDGFIIADHMYRNPVNMNLSGTISLNGSSSIHVSSDNSKLAGIEALFEQLKNDAVMCTVTKIQNVYANVSFIQRTNMVLTSIHWTENVNSLQYSFSFMEIMTASYEAIAITDSSDEFLPDITSLQTSNFVGASLDWGELDTVLVNTLAANDLIEDKFLDAVKGYAGAQLSNGYNPDNTASTVFAGIGTVAAGTAVASGVVLGKIATASAVAGTLAKAAGVSAATPIPGARVVAATLGIAAGIAAIAGVAYVISKNKQYKIKKFKYEKNEKKRQKEIDRFVDFVSKVHEQFQQLNEYVSTVTIPEDKAQECLLALDSQMYVFSFNKDNTKGSKKEYMLTVTCDNVTQGEGTKPVSAAAVENLTNCSKSNALFTTPGQSRAYLVHPSSAYNANSNGALTEYSMIIAKNNFDLSGLYDKIGNIVQEALSA